MGFWKPVRWPVGSLQSTGPGVGGRNGLPLSTESQVYGRSEPRD